eukprot:GEMP01007577.1.p1 GENE.GEMP01007577.1~~GEMP01007577.1.p1  ORF type:complete len:620 (+),score=135.84 GEMP01007577.1:129-1988(+)
MICPFRKLGCNGHHSGEKTDFHVNLLLRKILDLEKKFVDVDFSKLPRTDDREPTCDQGADEPSHETMLPVENGLTRAAYSPPYIGVPRMGAPTRDPRGALFRSSPRYSVGLLAEDSRPGSVESSCAPSANPTVTAAGSLPQRQRQQQTQKYTRQQRQLRQIQEQEPEQPHNAQRKQNQGNERALSRIPHPVSEQKRRGASTPTLTIVSLEHPESIDGAMSFPTQWSRWKTHPSTTASITTAFIPPHVSEQELSASQQRTNRLIRRQNKNMLRKNARQFRTTPNGRGKTKKKKTVALELSAQEVGGDGDHDHAMVPRARRALDPYIVHAGNNAEKSAAGSAFEDCNAVDSASTSMSTNASTGDGAHVSSSESSVEVETGPPSSWAAVGVGRTPHHVHAHFEQQSTPIVTQFTSSNTASANTASLSHWKGVQLPSGKTFHAFANDAQQLLARTGKARSPPAMMIFAAPPATPSTSSRNESISRRKARAFGREDDPYGFITDLADEDKAGESAKASAHQPSSPSYGSQPTKAASKDDIGEKVAKQNASTTRPASARKSSAPIAGWREFGGHESENGGEADRLGNYGEELKTMEIDIGTQSITLGSRETVHVPPRKADILQCG